MEAELPDSYVAADGREPCALSRAGHHEDEEALLGFEARLVGPIRSVPRMRRKSKLLNVMRLRWGGGTASAWERGEERTDDRPLHRRRSVALLRAARCSWSCSAASPRA